MPLDERLLALVLMLITCWCVVVLGFQRPRRIDVIVAVELLLGSAAWLWLHRAYEGPTVVRVSATHGLTVSDLWVPPCVLLALGVLLKAVRKREPRP
ncbi:MAG: hypothetical protein QOI82_1572 [Actinomycetota bacterium]|nr:hypothetical protein [Actinomycetota bacterium]